MPDIKEAQIELGAGHVKNQNAPQKLTAFVAHFGLPISKHDLPEGDHVSLMKSKHSCQNVWSTTPKSPSMLLS